MLIRTLFSTILSLVVLSASSIATAKGSSDDSGSKKGYRFKPVQSEDWPESADDPVSNQSDDEDRDPASAPSGMPKLRTLPDGSPDPNSIQDLLNAN